MSSSRKFRTSRPQDTPRRPSRRCKGFGFRFQGLWLRLLPQKWLKPRPESSLICAGLKPARNTPIGSACPGTPQGSPATSLAPPGLITNPVIRDWYFIAEQPAPAPHLAHPEERAALRSVQVTVLRVSHSCERLPDGFDLHVLQLAWMHPDQRIYIYT